MVFSSFAFLCFFLPVVLVLHTAVPGIRAKNALLIAASVIFYTYGELLYVLLLIASVAANYVFGRMLGGKRRRLVLAAAVILNLLMLGVFKYAGFFAETLNLLLPEAVRLPVPQIRLPIGISFYTFQALSYVIDVYRDDVLPQRKFSSLLLYISFFPQLIAGPIIRYHDVEAQIRERTVSAAGLRRGSFRFVCGLGKKILISNTMAYAADSVFALGGDVGTPAAWIGAVSYLLQIYFDFSGYSDMAIGLGQMFGFKFEENFNYPYISGSVQDFWRRWHISLSTWFREYLYIPLGGNRKGKARTLLNRSIVFFATGLWHGANWTFILWGLYHGALLVFESLGIIPVYRENEPHGKLGWLHRAASHVYVIFAVLLGFVLFRADTLGQAGAFIAAMFGFGAAGGASYVIASRLLSPYYIFIFALAVVGSTPYPRKLWLRLTDGESETSKRQLITMAASFCVILLCYMSLASASYNPFIYFRF